MHCVTLWIQHQHLFKKGFINGELSTCHCWQDPRDPRRSTEPAESPRIPMSPLARLPDRNAGMTLGERRVSDTKLEVANRV